MNFIVIDIFPNILQQFSIFINFFANFVIDCHSNFSIFHLAKIKSKHNTMFTDDTTQINESISLLLIQFISYHFEIVKVCATAQAHVKRSISLWDNRMSNLIQPLNFSCHFFFHFKFSHSIFAGCDCDTILTLFYLFQANRKHTISIFCETKQKINRALGYHFFWSLFIAHIMISVFDNMTQRVIEREMTIFCMLHTNDDCHGDDYNDFYFK